LLVFLDCFHILSKLFYLLMLHVQTRLIDFKLVQQNFLLSIKFVGSRLEG
jgi:hypothetical protein